MTATLKHQPSGIFRDRAPEAAEAEYHERLIASAAGMPRICHLKKCRRRGRCFGPFDGSLPCRRLHPLLYHQRFDGALRRLGWLKHLDGSDE